MNFRIVWRVAVSLFAVVILSVILIRATRYSYTEDHGPTNFGESGTAALAELLRKQGYEVFIPGKDRLPKDYVQMVTVNESSRDRFESFLEGLPTKKQSKVIALDFPDARPKDFAVPVASYVDQDDLGMIKPFEGNDLFFRRKLVKRVDPYAIVSTKNSEQWVVEISQSPSLSVVQVNCAYWLTNEYIDQANNASVIMGALKAYLPKETPIVFSSGFEDPVGVTEKMGPFYVGALNQLKVLILVILISLSFRFGLAPETRAIQRGGKELVDALAILTFRKGQNQWALRAMLDRVLGELEKRHRVNRVEIAKNPSKFLPENQADVILRAKMAIAENVEDRYALELANELARLV